LSELDYHYIIFSKLLLLLLLLLLLCNHEIHFVPKTIMICSPLFLAEVCNCNCLYIYESSCVLNVQDYALRGYVEI